jgi:AcrR family transcriptional regulator
MDLWDRVGRQAQPPRVALSYLRIALAGIEIADAEGLDAVSMRRVAMGVDAGAMSLYRYVNSRDDLVELMVDEVYSAFPSAPRSGDWRMDLAEAARRIRDVTLTHPWLAGRSVPRIGLGPNLLRMLESTLALVDGYGLTVDRMLDVLETLQAFVHGYVLDEITEQEAQRHTGLTLSQAQQQQESHVRRIMESGRYPQFARVVTDSADDLDPHVVFERRLRYILDGLASAFR